MPPAYRSGLVWFRRDLRAHDNTALLEALRSCDRVHCAFVFDKPILQPLPRQDRRVEFIRESVVEMASSIPGLMVSHAVAQEEIPRLAHDLRVQAVFANRDYEPSAMARDAAVRTRLARGGIAFELAKDQAIFDGDELLSSSGHPYSVFTPYKNAWLAKLAELQPAVHASPSQLARLAPAPGDRRVPSLAELGFLPTNIFEQGLEPRESGGARAFDHFLPSLPDYAKTRDYPSMDSTSRLGIHLRFGTVSVRELALAAYERMKQGDEGAATWLSELAWRDFFFQILANHPHVVDHSFRREYDNIEWESGDLADERFAAWCEGRTGFPIVDAAIAQINATGFMHNRLRMIAASFLVKDLGIDWRRGERWFAEKLNDYDLAANNGNWQWVASTGCDAQPWFRIFNPSLQRKRFDPDGSFVKRWLGDRAPVAPIVDHEEARQATLQRYEAARRAGRDSASGR